MSYMDRAIKSRDPRFARVLGKLGYERSDMVAEPAHAGTATVSVGGDGDDGLSASLTEVLHAADLKALRAEYKAAVGKNPFNGWDIATLRQKIAEAKG